VFSGFRLRALTTEITEQHGKTQNKLLFGHPFFHLLGHHPSPASSSLSVVKIFFLPQIKMNKNENKNE